MHYSHSVECYTTQCRKSCQKKIDEPMTPFSRNKVVCNERFNLLRLPPVFSAKINKYIYISELRDIYNTHSNYKDKFNKETKTISINASILLHNSYGKTTHNMCSAS